MSYTKAITIVSVLALSLTGIYAGLAFQSQKALAATPNPLTRTNISTWYWDWVDSTNRTTWLKDLDFAKNNNIKTIFLSINSTSKFVESTSPTKSELIAEVNGYQKDFITQANARGISVEALVAGNDWANPAKSYLPLHLLQYVSDFNTKYPASRFAGFHTDIEYYNQVDFNTNSTTQTLQYLTLVSQLVNNIKQIRLIQPTFSLSLDTKYNTDGTSTTYPQVIFQGATKHATMHALDLLSQLPGSTMTLISYRNYAKTSSGTVAMVKTEIDYVASKNYPIKIRVGQETDRVLDEPVVSFYGLPYSSFVSAQNYIIDSYSTTPQYGGIAIHYLKSFQIYKK